MGARRGPCESAATLRRGGGATFAPRRRPVRARHGRRFAGALRAGGGEASQREHPTARRRGSGRGGPRLGRALALGPARGREWRARAGHEASGGLLEAGSGVAPVCGRAQRQQRPLRPGSGTRTHHRRGRAGPRRRRALLHLRRSWRRESRRDRRRTETERAPQRWCPARPAHRGARPPGRRADRGRGRDRAARRWRRPRGRSGREVTERRRIEREVGLQADVLDQVDAAVKRWNRNGWSCTGTGGPRHPTATPPRRRSVGRCAI